MGFFLCLIWKKFYEEVFGLHTVLDGNENVILTEGLVLQEEKIWQDALGKEIAKENHACELYFEEQNIEDFVEKLDTMYPGIRYVTPLTTLPWGQKLVRFYDLDGHMIEVRN